MTLDRCPWYVAGPIIGLIIVVLRATLNRPFGALGGYIELLERVRTPGQWGAAAFVMLGTVAGGLLFALVAGPLAPTLSYDAGTTLLPAGPGRFASIAVAGVVMGYGARLAGGCTSGHGLCGVSLGSPASVVSTMTFFATAVLLAHLIASIGAI